jgi:hypothetical protein
VQDKDKKRKAPKVGPTENSATRPRLRD